MQKIAIVCSGWHYPLSYYEMMAKQKLPEGWVAEFFCISHRDPIYAQEEKKDDMFIGDRAYLDKRLYNKVATKEEIESLGWTYIVKPNTIGDLGNINQWLSDYNYKDYELLLFSHDDNLILNDSLFLDIIDENFKEWHILCNSVGVPPGAIRGSFEFYKPIVLDKLGGKFDLSEVSLKREGETKTSGDILEIYDWNATVYPLQRTILEEKLIVGHLSPAYRVSAYCIEGERGYIHKTHGSNTLSEDEGLKFLKHHGII